MKRFLTTIVIVCISSLTFSQSFYKYQGKKIDLIKDSSTFVIQTYKHLFETLNASLEEQFQKREIEFYQKMPNSRFLVIGNKPKPEYYFYFSYSYRTFKNALVIILPRIAIMLKEGVTLQPVLDKFE